MISCIQAVARAKWILQCSAESRVGETKSDNQIEFGVALCYVTVVSGLEVNWTGT